MVLSCGHASTVSNLDSYLELSRVYDLSSGSAIPLSSGIGDPKGCMYCRTPISGLFRYGRITGKLFLGESLRKFMRFSDAQLSDFELQVSEIEQGHKSPLPLLKKVARLQEKLRSPVKRVTELATASCRGDISQVISIGLPTANEWPALRLEIAVCRLRFAEWNKKKKLDSIFSYKGINKVIRRLQELKLGRGEALALIARAKFRLVQNCLSEARDDLNLVIQSPNEAISGGPIGNVARELLKYVQAGGEVTVASILQAAGGGNGGWYHGSHTFTCPNGHFYVIGDCGGAMTESKCPECGAAIGGGSHTLRADNINVRNVDSLKDTVPPGFSSSVVDLSAVMDAGDSVDDETEQVDMVPESAAQVIAHQDAEYAASLAADRAGDRAKLRRRNSLEKLRTPTAQPLPLLEPEPDLGLCLRVRLSSSTLERRFNPGSTIGHVRYWIRMAAASSGELLPAAWVLVGPDQRSLLDDLDRQLRDIGLNNSLLHIREIEE